MATYTSTEQSGASRSYMAYLSQLNQRKVIPDPMTWPKHALTFRNTHENVDDTAEIDSLLTASSVDTEQLLISPHHYHLHSRHGSNYSDIPYYSDDDLPALPLSNRKNKNLYIYSLHHRKNRLKNKTRSNSEYIQHTNRRKNIKIPPVSSYFSNQFYSNSNSMESNEIVKCKQQDRAPSVVLPISPKHKNGKYPSLKQCNSSLDPLKIAQSSPLKQSPLTKENILKLNKENTCFTESIATLSDTSEQVNNNLDKIGKELRKISIFGSMDVEHNGSEIPKSIDTNTQVTSRSMSRRVLPVQTQKLKHREGGIKKAIKQNKRHSSDFGIKTPLGELIEYDAEEKEMDFKSTIYGKNFYLHKENRPKLKRTEQCDDVDQVSEVSTATISTMPFCLIPMTRRNGSADQGFLKKLYSSNSSIPRSVAVKEPHSNSLIHDILHGLDDDDEEEIIQQHIKKMTNTTTTSTTVSCSKPYARQTEIKSNPVDLHGPNVKISFKRRTNSSLCANIWLILFHSTSLISYLSEGYVYKIYYDSRGKTVELLGWMAVSTFIFIIYILMLLYYNKPKTKWKQKEYAFVHGTNPKRKRVVSRSLIISSMLNCSHFTLQFVAYIFLLIVWTENDWMSLIDTTNNFDTHQLLILVTILLIQCVCLSMTILNIFGYLMERKHYHFQSLSFRVLSFFLDIIRIAFVVYIAWNATDQILSSFYYFYFYAEYWILFLLLATARYILICANIKGLYQRLGIIRFIIYCIYSLIEPIFRFIIVEMFPHLSVYCMIHNIGTGKFDHFQNYNCLSIKNLSFRRTFDRYLSEQHYRLLDLFEFIQNGLYECIHDDAFQLSGSTKQEIMRRVLVVNYQLMMGYDTTFDEVDDDERLLTLHNIISFEYQRMKNMAMYPWKMHKMKQNGKVYDDLFLNRSINSHSHIFMQWFVQNDLISNFHFEWNQGFIIGHALFTGAYCKYLLCLCYIFTRITNVCWMYFICMNWIIHLLYSTTEEGVNQFLMLYTCASIVALHIFAHFMWIVLGMKAYKFEKCIWYLMPTLNANHLHKLLNGHAKKSPIDIYEWLCYNHMVGNRLYRHFGYNAGGVILSYLDY